MKKWTTKDYREMPWKNGGGSTTELAVFPEGASMDDFAWRLSTATVKEDGPFSHFENIDRTLAVLSGNGLVLNGEKKSVTLDQSSQPYAFDGEMEVQAQLCEDTVIDLNMMTRRGVCQHYMQRMNNLHSGEHQIQAKDAQQILVYCVQGAGTLQGELAYSEGDLFFFEEEVYKKGIALSIHASPDAILYLVRIHFMQVGKVKK
jgi:environmental stress-induced protein Ves